MSKSLFGYELDLKQDVIINYLTPALLSYLQYIIIIASDFTVIYKHYNNEDPVWASLSIFITFLPSIASYIYVISSWELWPDYEGFSIENYQWAVTKTLEHLLFPIWTIWRFAEKIFWSIEALRDQNSYAEAIENITAPRTVELYLFLQAYLHCLPQILFQLHILMRLDFVEKKQTAEIQMVSIIINLSKIAMVTTLYQRFKSQKIAGRNYPWYKDYKTQKDLKRQAEETIRSPQRRRSSDFYLEPIVRETSVVDGPTRTVLTEPDFNIRRLNHVRGLPEDDFIGKLVSFCWWFCFILARILAISTFFYFYQTATLWLLSVHVVLTISLLLYDVKTDNIRRSKIVFFAFIAYIYLFCIIEFKIQFKKSRMIYLAFFSAIYVENFAISMVWWFKNVDELQNDFWFRYIFYFVVMCSMISLFSMLFYLVINKPKKIIVHTEVI